MTPLLPAKTRFLEGLHGSNIILGKPLSNRLKAHREDIVQFTLFLSIRLFIILVILFIFLAFIFFMAWQQELLIRFFHAVIVLQLWFFLVRKLMGGKISIISKSTCQPGTVFLFGDGMHLVHQNTAGYCWADPKNQPILKLNAGRQRFNILGADNPDCHSFVHFSGEENCNAERVTEYFEVILKAYKQAPKVIRGCLKITYPIFALAG